MMKNLKSDKKTDQDPQILILKIKKPDGGSLDPVPLTKKRIWIRICKTAKRYNKKVEKFIKMIKNNNNNKNTNKVAHQG